MKTPVAEMTGWNKLTWLALAEDHEALSRSLEQLMALPRPVKVKRVLLVSLAAKFLAEAAGVRATATCFHDRALEGEGPATLPLH